MQEWILLSVQKRLNRIIESVKQGQVLVEHGNRGKYNSIRRPGWSDISISLVIICPTSKLGDSEINL